MAIPTSNSSVNLPTGHLEPDSFIINDIELRIPPESIQIDKQSFNHEWSTLRTQQSRQMKSGYSIARVSFEVVFRGAADFQNMIALAAGLRATPFCVVRNRYLSTVLGHPGNKDVSILDEDRSYRSFQPSMLALSSMNFSTGGSDGKPDCIKGVFDFIWFNYLPFTPVVAFKGGADYSRPVTAEYSEPWKAFYRPFLQKGVLPVFPHTGADRPTTTFLWREFKLVSPDTLSNPAPGKGLAGSMNEVKKAFASPTSTPASLPATTPRIPSSSASSTVQGEQTEPEGEDTVGDVEDIVFARNVTNGVVNPTEATSQQMSEVSKKPAVDSAALLLAQRQAALKQNSSPPDPSKDEEFQRIIASQSKVTTGKGTSTSLGAMEVWGRKRRYSIEHQRYGQDLVGAVIQHITISFENTLAIIPMVGYRYPTIQHVGSMRTKIHMAINARNFSDRAQVSDVEKLNKMYDSMETMALRFRQIPMGKTNLIVKNDFLQMFGIEECLPDQIRTETIPGMPARSMVSLSLSENGIISGTTIKGSTDGAEDIQQEFVGGEIGVFKECWRILNQYLHKNSETNIIRKEYFFVSSWGIPTDDAHKQLKDLVEETVTVYNGFIGSVHTAIFDPLMTQSIRGFLSDFVKNPVPLLTYDNSRNKMNRAYLASLTEDGSSGYIPGLKAVQDGVEQRAKDALEGSKDQSLSFLQRRAFSQIADTSNAQTVYPPGLIKDPISTIPQLERQLSLTTDPAQRKDIQRQIDTGLDYHKKLGWARGDLHIEDYKNKMRNIFQKITSGLALDLPEFASVKKALENLGIDKGLFAYPDFKSQLASVASLVGLDEGKGVKNGSLLKIDPDCYFWYPKYQGGGASPLSGLIDPATIGVAKQHSIGLNNSAQDSVGSFFSTHYRNRLDGGDSSEKLNNVAIQALDKYALSPGEDRSKLASPYASAMGSIVNGTRAPLDEQGSTGISTSNLVIDSSKSFTTSIPKDQFIQCPHTISHDPFSLLQQWEGISVSTGPTSPSASMIEPEGSLDSLRSKMRSSFSSSPGQIFSKWPVDMNKCEILTTRKNSVNGLHYGAYDIQFPGQAKVPNEPITPVADGVIIGKGGVGGRGVIVRHVVGKQVWTTGYMHFSAWGDIQVKNNVPVNGQKVTKSTVLGYMGSSHGTIGTKSFSETGYWHLHFGVKKGNWGGKNPGTDMDPLLLCPPLPGSGGKRANIQRRTPSPAQSDKIARLKAEVPGRDVTTTIKSPLAEAIKEFEMSQLLGQGQGFMRAYPTFKLYFIEDDSGERKRLGFDDFFSYSAVQSIRVVRDREIAADLTEITMTNVSGVLSNRKFRQDPMVIDPITGEIRSYNTKPHTKAGEPATETKDPMKKDTREENPIASLLLQEGVDIQLRMGYSSDPDLLDIVFNGVIVEVMFSESDDIVTILAQSHAIELVQDIKGLEKPDEKTAWITRLGNFSSPLLSTGASTVKLLESMMSQPEVTHFGRFRAADGLSKGIARDLLTTRWRWVDKPQDDNIFAPSPQQELPILGDSPGGALSVISRITAGFVAPTSVQKELGLNAKWSEILFHKLKYTIYRTTIWDIFQEMTLRHPNFIASPVPYRDQKGPRMTMFYGLPNQLYFARDASPSEMLADKKLQEITKQKAPSSPTVTSRDDEGRPLPNLPAAAPPPSSVERLALAMSSGWIRPFRNYHLITSSQHIISNAISTASRDVANTIAIKYGSEIPVKDSKGGQTNDVAAENAETFVLKVDCALPPEETRTQLGNFINVSNSELAKRYAAGLLAKSLRKAYRGELVILGNAKIKPHDVVYLMDEYSDMIGAFEVAQVQHILDQEHGFRTEIKPEMLVQVAEWTLMNAADALGVVMEGYMGRKSSGTPIDNNGVAPESDHNFLSGSFGRQSLSLIPYIVGHVGNAFGGFMSQKLLTYTQLAQPIVMSPMLHHGRTFAGGIPTRKLPVSPWTTIFGKWNSAVDIGYDAWIEDIKDGMIGWIEEATAQHSVGDFWTNGGSGKIRSQ